MNVDVDVKLEELRVNYNKMLKSSISDEEKLKQRDVYLKELDILKHESQRQFENTNPFTKPMKKFKG